MIAKTILEQMGGHGFAAMTGSKHFIDLGDGLQMSLARNKTSANRLRVVLDEATDTYTMCFYRQSVTKNLDIKVKEIAKYEEVYFDICATIHLHASYETLHPFLTLWRVAGLPFATFFHEQVGG